MADLNVLIADDQTLLRVSIRMLLDAVPGFHVVGEAVDGADAVAQTLRLRPDVVLMDVRMPGTDGIEATRRITEATDTRVLILTTFDLDEYVFAGLEAGAAGFLLKDAPPQQLLEGIRVVSHGDGLLSPSVTRRLVAEFVQQRAKPLWKPDLGRVAALTGREREVLTLVAQGLTNAEITEHLVVSLSTAKTHVSRLLTKLGAANRAQLVIIAYEAGLGRPS